MHQFIPDDGFLADEGLHQLLGLHSIGYFAPHTDYASDGARGASRCTSSRQW